MKQFKAPNIEFICIDENELIATSGECIRPYTCFGHVCPECDPPYCNIHVVK